MIYEGTAYRRWTSSGRKLAQDGAQTRHGVSLIVLVKNLHQGKQPARTPNSSPTLWSV